MSDITKQGLKDSIESLEQRLSQLNQSISSLEVILDEKQKAVTQSEEEFAKAVQYCETEISAKQGTLNGLNKTILFLKENKASLVLDISELNKKNELFSRLLLETKTELEESKQELLQLQKKKDLAKDIPEIKIKENLVKDIKELNREKDNVTSQHNKLLQEKNSTEDSLRVLKPSLEQLQIEQVKLQKGISQLQSSKKFEEELSLDTKMNIAKEKDSLLKENTDLKSNNLELKKDNQTIQSNSAKTLKDILDKEKNLEGREESYIFQLNNLLIKEKRLRQREEALGIGLEINQ